MFNFFKPKQPERRQHPTQEWWYEADEAYEFACNRRLTSGLALFFKGAAIKYIMSKITHLKPNSEGMTTYRNTKFKKLKTSDGSIKYKREVTFDDIQLSRYVKVPMGEPYTEKWTLEDNETKVVSDIERLEPK